MSDYKTLLVCVWCLKMLNEIFLREVSGQRVMIFQFHCLCIFHPAPCNAVDKDTQGPVTAGTLQNNIT